MIENTWLRLKRHLQSIKNRIYSQDQLNSEITLFGKTYRLILFISCILQFQEDIRMTGHLTKY